MKINLMLLKDVTDGRVRATHVQLDDEFLASMNEVRISEYVEVELPDRDADEIKQLTARIRFRRIKKLRDERDALLTAEMGEP